MKNYLNAKDKADTLILAMLAGRLDQMIVEKEHAGIHEDEKDFVRSLRMCRTYAYKALDCVMKPLSRDYVDKFLKEAKKREIVVLWKGENLKKIQEHQQAENNVTLDRRFMETLRDLCMASCDVCEATPQFIKNCDYRYAMMKAGFDVMNPYAGKDECPYKVKTNEETLERMKQNARKNKERQRISRQRN